MTTPELAKAMERQQREARRRRERSQQTMDRIRSGRTVTPGLMPIGDPDVLEQEATHAEVMHLVRRGAVAVVLALGVAACAVWLAVQMPAQGLIGIKASAGFWLTALGVALVGSLLAVRALLALRTLRRIHGWSPEAVSPSARATIWASSAGVVACGVVSTLVMAVLVFG